jgi:hypothetical protein
VPRDHGLCPSSVVHDEQSGPESQLLPSTIDPTWLHAPAHLIRPLAPPHTTCNSSPGGTAPGPRSNQGHGTVPSTKVNSLSLETMQDLVNFMPSSLNFQSWHDPSSPSGSFNSVLREECFGLGEISGMIPNSDRSFITSENNILGPQLSTLSPPVSSSSEDVSSLLIFRLPQFGTPS